MDDTGRARAVKVTAESEGERNSGKGAKGGKGSKGFDVSKCKVRGRGVQRLFWGVTLNPKP